MSSGWVAPEEDEDIDEEPVSLNFTIPLLWVTH